MSWAAAQTWEAAEDIHCACEEAGVQFMDGTMWVHSRRAAKMAGVIKSDLGQLKSVNSAFAFPGALVSCPAHILHFYDACRAFRGGSASRLTPWRCLQRPRPS